MTTSRTNHVLSRKPKGIAEHPSYIGIVSKVEAEKKFEDQEDYCYLTRYDKARATYELMVIKKKGSTPQATK